MKKSRKSILCLVLAAVLALSLCPSALAAENVPAAIQEGENRVVFSNISHIAAGESVQYAIHKADGSTAVVGIESVSQYARGGGRTFRVWYRSVGVDVEFYMTVLNNRVTSVYDYSISLLAATFEDAELTKTSTYGKLTFTAKALGGLAASTCWLKGTVTGVDDEIETTWQM